MKKEMKTVEIYTDGACSCNPGPGGWGAVLIYNGKEKRLSGFEDNTTNNRMELLAVIQALNKLKEPCNVTLYSDSAYVVNAFEQNWIEDWQIRNWRTAGKKEVKNIDLWQKLLEYTKTHNITFNKVKGHSTNLYNNICDSLARSEIEKRQGV